METKVCKICGRELPLTDFPTNNKMADGWDEAIKSEIPKIHPKLKGSDPDYWERLKHQYAGMAMQGILSNPDVDLDYKSDECMPQAVAATAYYIAHALVERYKKEEK